MAEPEIICERRGPAGLVTLNRPTALNALNHGMVRVLASGLATWRDDPGVTRVVVKAAGDKAFCAGGDIRALYDAIREDRADEALAFWRDEYRLNVAIKRFPKPYIALIDGIVMGGGVGISLHGSHRAAGDRYRFAMPEVGIGFFPDVGATWALPRLPGATGTYLALTGARIGADDAVALGLANHALPSADFAEAETRLLAGEPVDQVLDGLARPVTAGPVGRERELIDRCFSAGSVTRILARLDEAAEAGSGFARDSAAAIRSKAPSSVTIGLEQMRRGGSLSFEEALATEYRIVNRVAREPDFPEGIRAAIIDRDGAPRWRPATLAEVDPDWVAAHFAPLPGHGEELPPC